MNPKDLAGRVNVSATASAAKEQHHEAGTSDPLAAPAQSAPVVFGLDLSLTATGISDGRGTWAVRSKGYKTDTLADRAQRLALLVVGITDHVRGAALVVIEGPAFASISGHMHDRSGLWWLVVQELRASGTPVAEVAPAALKAYATGKGNANKGAMVDATARRFPHVETGADDNRCDALWLAHMGIDQLTGRSVVPAAQRARLEKVAWPEAAA